MKYLKKVSDVLAKVPSMGYALAYLLLIPAFAFMYWMLPYDFYHSTVQYERILNTDADEILQEIRDSIIEEFIHVHGSYQAEEGNWSLNIKDISMGYLKTESERTRFTIRLVLWGLNEIKGVKSSIPVNIYIENKMTFGTQTDNGKFIVVKRPEIENEEHLVISPSLIFPFKPNDSSWSVGGNSVLFPISKALNDKILAFSQSVKGFPVKASGAFARMFYFSAVTITTLGYGDIVPITSKARTLVALESIAGIVLIGLFLNSLSREHNKA